MRSGYEVAGGRLGGFDEAGSRLEIRRHGLLDQHVLAGGECLLGEFAVSGHRGEDQDELDVGMADHIVGSGQVGGDAVLRRGEGSLLGPVVVDGLDLDVPIADQWCELRAIGALEDVTEPDNADPNHASSVLSSRAVA